MQTKMAMLGTALCSGLRRQLSFGGRFEDWQDALAKVLGSQIDLNGEYHCQCLH